ncbi:MAG: hypothetical protein R3F61_06870 [Myxococcota bacterium]
MVHAYQDPHATLTLREGLAEYFASDPTLTDPDDCSPEGAELFRRHDAVHIVFGTNRELEQEAMTDAWTAFGTTAPWSVFREYLAVPEVAAVFADIGVVTSVLGSIRATPSIWRVWRHSRRMREPWPFDGYAAHYDHRLCDLREQYGIELVRQP